MKKLMILILTALMMVSAASAEGSRLCGGWESSSSPEVTEELKSLFEKGTDTLTGMSYIPVAYLGSQVVAGTNHAFLCRAVSAYPELETTVEEPVYAMVYLYEDLSGNVSILCISGFEIGSLCNP